jgi:hypothetical protein
VNWDSEYEVVGENLGLVAVLIDLSTEADGCFCKITKGSTWRRNRVLGEIKTIKRQLPCGRAAAAPPGQSGLAQRKKSQQLAKEAKLTAADFKAGLCFPGPDSWVSPIVDIDCGRGEWLEILKENHLQAYGIDANVMMVEHARLSGLDVREADLVAHLRELPDASRSPITAFHVVEHLIPRLIEDSGEIPCIWWADGFRFAA